jgi:hypothetical protein
MTDTTFAFKGIRDLLFVLIYFRQRSDAIVQKNSSFKILKENYRRNVCRAG